jgi:hypothetical protein
LPPRLVIAPNEWRTRHASCGFATSIALAADAPSFRRSTPTNNAQGIASANCIASRVLPLPSGPTM